MEVKVKHSEVKIKQLEKLADEYKLKAQADILKVNFSARYKLQFWNCGR